MEETVRRIKKKSDQLTLVWLDGGMLDFQDPEEVFLEH